MTFSTHAAGLRALGFSVFPTHAPGMKPTKAMVGKDGVVDEKQIGKCPLVKWKPLQNKWVDDETFNHWVKRFPNANIAVLCGPVSNLLALDVDGVAAAMALQELEDRHEPLPDTWRVATSRGCHIYFRYSGGDIRNTQGELGPGIESKTTAQTVHGIGSIHRSGHVYDWVATLSPADIPLADAPEWLLDLLRKPTLQARKKISSPVKRSTDLGTRENAYRRKAWDGMISELATATPGARNGTLFKVAANARRWINAGQMSESEVDSALRMHAANIGLDALEIDNTLKSAFGSVKDQVDLPDWWGQTPTQERRRRTAPQAPVITNEDGTQFNGHTGEIYTNGHHIEPTLLALPAPDADSAITLIGKYDDDDDVQTPEMRRKTIYCANRQHSDMGNAQRLLCWFGDEIMYSDATDWMVWNGIKWVRDKHAVVRMAHKTAHRIRWEEEHAGGLDEQRATAKWQLASSSSDKISSMVKMAASIKTFDPEKLDADPWLLNTKSGIVDLRTGIVHPHDPRAMLSKICPYEVAPDGHMPEKFIRFIEEISCGDAELMDFHQRHLGYALTGSTQHQCLFFYYGGGRNGKSTLTEIMQAVMGDYAVADTTDLLLDTRAMGNIEFRMVRLHGARALFLQELKEGSVLDMGVVKRITGSDTLSGRHLHKSHIQWKPTHKVFLASNHQPQVTDQTDGTWRRMRLIPFEARFEGSKEILNFSEKLLAEEGPQIMRWLIDGAARGSDGSPLPTPTKVLDATASYREDEDVLAEFISETFDVITEETERASEVYDSFVKWCQFRREVRMGKWSSMLFGKKMSERGFKKVKISYKRFRGLKFKAMSATPWRQESGGYQNGYVPDNSY